MLVHSRSAIAQSWLQSTVLLLAYSLCQPVMAKAGSVTEMLVQSAAGLNDSTDIK